MSCYYDSFNDPRDTVAAWDQHHARDWSDRFYDASIRGFDDTDVEKAERECPSFVPDRRRRWYWHVFIARIERNDVRGAKAAYEMLGGAA